MENIKKPWVEWNVKGTQYKLKLTTAAIVSLENKLKCNLLDILNSGTIPQLNIMADIIHASMSKYHHGIKNHDVSEILDDYFDEGGSQLDLLTNVIVPIYTVSGFFPRNVAEKVDYKMEEAKELMEE